MHLTPTVTSRAPDATWQAATVSLAATTDAHANHLPKPSQAWRSSGKARQSHQTMLCWRTTFGRSTRVPAQCELSHGPRAPCSLAMPMLPRRSQAHDRPTSGSAKRRLPTLSQRIRAPAPPPPKRPTEARHSPPLAARRAPHRMRFRRCGAIAESAEGARGRRQALRGRNPGGGGTRPDREARSQTARACRHKATRLGPKREHAHRAASHPAQPSAHRAPPAGGHPPPRLRPHPRPRRPPQRGDCGEVSGAFGGLLSQAACAATTATINAQRVGSAQARGTPSNTMLPA